MAFFDDVSKKITQVSQNVVSKTKEATDIVRIKGVLTENEKQLHDLYKEIGALYFEKHYEDFEPEFETLMNNAKITANNIAAYEYQINEIKSITKCEKCGAEISKEAAFCNVCGAPVVKQAPPAMLDGTKRCPTCLQPITPGFKFCTGCGTPVEEQAEAPAPAPVYEAPVAPVAPVYEAPVAPVYEAPVAPVVEPVAVRVCPVCSTPAEADCLFCTSCGTKL